MTNKHVDDYLRLPTDATRRRQTQLQQEALLY